MWLNGNESLNDNSISRKNNDNSISNSNSYGIFSKAGSGATTTLAAAAARLVSGAGAAAASVEFQQTVSHSDHHSLLSIINSNNSNSRNNKDCDAPTTSRQVTKTHETSSSSSTDSGHQKERPTNMSSSWSSNVQQQQKSTSSSAGNTTTHHPADRPEKFSFHLKTSIFTRRVTIDRDELALGSIKQLAVAFLNELYFQHSYPPNTYIGDYIGEHYSQRDDLSHLYERLILRKYSCDQDCFVPFNSAGDIEPEAFISIEVGERVPRHLLMNNRPTTTTSLSANSPNSSGNQSDSANQLFLSAQQQVNLAPVNSASPQFAESAATIGGISNINSSSSSTSTSSSIVVTAAAAAAATTTATTTTHLIRMTHDFKQETYLKFTYCASCSDLIKGIIRQGYQCKNCKKNYCCDCKTRAELPGSSDSCLVPVNSGNLIGGNSSNSTNSSLANLFASNRNNNNSIDITNNNNSASNNPGSPSSGNKLEISHTNMSKRKSASNLLQHLNLANPFKTHHNNQQQQQQQQQQQTPHQILREDKSKTRGSAGALEPVLHQLSKQREQQQQQHHCHHHQNPKPSSELSSASGSGNTLLVAQTTQLSSSHQNLYMNHDKDDVIVRTSDGKQVDDDSETATGLQRLSNSARASTTDLHAATASNKMPIKRDQANHSFTLMDMNYQKSITTPTTTTMDVQRCDVCNKSLKSGQQQQQQQQQPFICKNCKLLVHSQCQNLVLTDCMSRIAESSRAAAAAAEVKDDNSLDQSGDGDPAVSGDKTAIHTTNSNLSRDNIRLHRLAPSIKHVKRPDLTKPILEGWLKHTTLSDEQARQHYWRLDETDLTLYEDDKSTRYFKAIALNKITRVMSSRSLPKQIREGVLLDNALLSSHTIAANKQAQSGLDNEQSSSSRARSATTSPIKTPLLLAQMKAMFAFELATGSMYLVQAQSESEASKWRELLANVTGKTNQPEDKQSKRLQQAPADSQVTAVSPAKRAEQQQQPFGTVDKFVESVNRIDLQKDKTVDPPTSALVAIATEDQAKGGQLADDKTPNNGDGSPSAAAIREKQAPRQPAVQRQHHHRYPPSGHRRANFIDPSRSRLYNRPRKEIKLNKMDIPDHLIEAKYLVEKDHAKGCGFVELGSGQFGKVYAAISEYKAVDADKSIWSGVPVAIKEISKARFDLRQQAKLKNEANILSGLDHPGVIILERVHDLPDKIYIVMEQLEDDMLEMIVSTPEKRLNERVTKFLTYQILEALKYLHAQKIAHCDLKPENVLLVDKHTLPQIKLCDFGFAKIIEENSFRSSLVGTPAYLAPEVVKGERYNRSVDLWSVGVIVYVSLSGEFPFNEGENIHDQISRAKFMYPDLIWSKVSQQAIDFINSLLRVNCENRLSASTAQMDVWIQDFKLWCDLSDFELRVGKRCVTDDADFDRWSRYASANGHMVPSSVVQLHESLDWD